MMSEDWLREQLSNLKINELRTQTLHEIKNELLNSGGSNLSSTFIHNADLFDCADGEDSQQKKLAENILEICMENLKIQPENDFSELLERALTHANPNIQALAVNEIARVLRLPNGNKSIDLNIFHLLIKKSLPSAETKVGTPTILLLIELLPQFIDISNVKVHLESNLDGSDVIRCRTYEIAIKVSKKSAHLLEKLNFILNRAIADIDNPDILLQLNIMELLSDLASTEHGLVYLENKKVFEILLKKVETIEENPLAGILAPGLMKFFGNIAAIQPSKIINDYPQIISSLFDCLAGNDFQLLPISFDTLANCCKTDEGKKAVDQIPGGKIKDALRDIVDSLQNYPTEIKIRALSCLEGVFFVDPENVNNQISYITQKWYEAISPPPSNLATVMRFCQNPFPDIALAAFGALKSIALHRWGHEVISNTAGLIEYLLDRRVAADKDVKQEKFVIISMLAESSIFNAQQIIALKKFVKEGAFYVQGVTEVAFDGAS